MAKSIKGLLVAACILSFTSCFKEEAPNAECDILTASVTTENINNLFYNASDALIAVDSGDSIITFNVRSHADLSALAPSFVLTEGASIEPASASVHDFSNGQKVRYTVTSEDKAWHRTYTVAFNQVTKYKNDTIRYDFEHFEKEAKKQQYYVWHDLLDDGQLGNNWATGNPGFAISMSSAAPEAYPTVPEEAGVDGFAVRLTTSSTGPWGAAVKKPIAAGNLFLGSFDVRQALLNTLKTTRFGIPFTKQPTKFTGYYKYRPGTTYQDETTKPIEGKVDQASIYAVVYKNHDAAGQPVTLYGDDVKTHPLIVALAEVKEIPATDAWTAFEATFDYTSDIDMELLANRGYSLALVFSSSNEGDKFRGAIGSTLYIDKVRVICKSEE